jgi:hypothetical protein
MKSSRAAAAAERRLAPALSENRLARVQRCCVVSLITVCTIGCEPSLEGPGADPRSGSGVTGVTVVDEGCPTLPPGETCPTGPLPAELEFVRPDSGSVVTVVRTGEDGRFTVDLPPGTYVIRPDNLSGDPLPSAEPVTVHVAGNARTTVTVQFDSGVR